MPFRPYENKEYIDWLTGTNFLGETIADGADRVTLPTKMNIRDMAVFISGPVDGATVRIEYSPDDMETKETDLITTAMTWLFRDDGEFIIPASANIWENLDAAEGWIRMRIINAQPTTNPKIQTRPRIEKVI